MYLSKLSIWIVHVKSEKKIEYKILYILKYLYK